MKITWDLLFSYWLFYWFLIYYIFVHIETNSVVYNFIKLIANPII